MAKPPSSAAENPASAPDSLPIGVRAPAMITEPAIRSLPENAKRVGSSVGSSAAKALVGVAHDRVAAGADDDGVHGAPHGGLHGARHHLVDGLAREVHDPLIVGPYGVAADRGHAD